MENGLPLFAAIICAVCAVLAFISGNSLKIKKAILILWILSAAAVLLAAVLMIILQVSCRFEYQYVCGHISRDMAVMYKISALWSGQEGSFLLWAAIMVVMGFFMLPNGKNRDGKTFGIYALISFCIFIMCFISQPFQKISPIPPDGLGLNEALKDPWMAFHPPLVFISYSAMAILFALSAIVHKVDASKRIVFWLRISWVFLGAGILSGSVWAYRALGWGGYWAWDPIENAALVPWLIICGYMHTKKHNAYPVCILPFSVACFGAFIVRSGILENLSVHAYSGGNLGVSIIILCVIIGAALYLIINKLRERKNNKMPARPAFNIIKGAAYAIYGYAALIFLGTIAPVITKSEVPTVYFTIVNVIFVLAYNSLLLLKDRGWLKKRGVFMAAISMVFVVAFMAITRTDKLGWLLLLWFCFMPVSLWLTAGFPNGLKYHLIHLGVSLLIIGAVASSAFSGEAFVIAPPGGDQVIIAGVVIPLAELQKNSAVIKSLPLGDIIIQCPQITDLAQDGLLIPYVTKPLIILFWLGGAVTVAAPLYIIFSERFRGKKAKRYDGGANPPAFPSL